MELNIYNRCSSGGRVFPAMGECPMNLRKLKSVKGKGSLGESLLFLTACSEFLARLPSICPIRQLWHRLPFLACCFWEELQGQVLGAWQVPDQLCTRNRGEERMPILSPPLAPDQLEALQW